MNVLSMKELMQKMEERGHKVSRLTMTSKLTPLLEEAGLAQHIGGGNRGVWVYAPEAEDAIIKYLKHHAQARRAAPLSKHTIEAFNQYAGAPDVSYKP